MQYKNDCEYTITNEITGKVITGTTRSAKELLSVILKTAEIDATLVNRFSEDEAQKILEDFVDYCQQVARL